MQMPEKDVGFWVAALAWLKDNSPAVYAALLSITLSTMRVLRAGGPVREWLFEGPMCGLIVLAAVSGLDHLGLPDSMAPVIGGWVGLVGFKRIERAANTWLNNKTSPNGENNGK